MHTRVADPEARRGGIEFAAGIATYNDAGTIGPLLQAIESGLAGSFPSGRFAIIHADAGSKDGTSDVARRAVPGDCLIQVQFELDPLSGPGVGGSIPPAAVRCFLGEARRLEAGGCVILDARGHRIPGWWVERLARPVIADGMDFVAPYYRQHPFDRAITSGIAFPLQRALYGRPVRFPLAGDFAASPRFIDAALAPPSWPVGLGGFGVETWLVTRALTGDFRVGQAWLGVKEPWGTEREGEESSGSDLSAVLVQVLGALFSELERNVGSWQKPRRTVAVPLLGSPLDGEPVPVAVDIKRAVDAFRLGQRSLEEVWRLVLPPASLLELSKLAQSPEGAFRLPDRLWARAVYDFALAYRLRVMNRDHLLAAFVPLYQGWLGSFALEMGDPDSDRAEQRIEELCSHFEVEKPYLISRWRWPDRFTP